MELKSLNVHDHVPNNDGWHLIIIQSSNQINAHYLKKNRIMQQHKNPHQQEKKCKNPQSIILMTE